MGLHGLFSSCMSGRALSTVCKSLGDHVHGGEEREFVRLAFLVTGTALGTGYNSALLPDLLLGHKKSMYYEMACVTI